MTFALGNYERLGHATHEYPYEAFRLLILDHNKKNCMNKVKI